MPRDPGEFSFGSPWLIVCEHFEWLRRAITRIITAPQSDRHLAQDCAAVIMLSVSAVEVFLNAYFGIKAIEQGSKDLFLDECRGRRRTPAVKGQQRLRIDEKLTIWTERYVGNKARLEMPPLSGFLELKNDRNNLVHFWSDMSHEVEVPGVGTLKGLVDTYEYHRLRRSDVYHAYTTIEGVVREVFRLSGAPDEHQVRLGLQRWTGRVAGTELPWFPWSPRGPSD